ncbi:MAG: hypothetical protein SWK90_12775 [Chloroflexota bacterium]|nr:hypothetical protein [Chloroflexota bacterium]
MDLGQYYDKTFTFYTWTGVWTGRRVLGLLVGVIVMLLLSRERLMVGTALVRSG